MEKRSASYALVNTISNIAQIYSPYLYDQKDSPRYVTAMIANACFVLGAIAAATVLYFALRWENRKLDAAEASRQDHEGTNANDGVGMLPGAKIAGGHQLDPSFRYML